MDKQKIVSQDTAKELAKKLKAQFYSVSAKYNRGIHKLFYNTGLRFINRKINLESSFDEKDEVKDGKAEKDEREEKEANQSVSKYVDESSLVLVDKSRLSDMVKSIEPSKQYSDKKENALSSDNEDEANRKKSSFLLGDKNKDKYQDLFKKTDKEANKCKC